MNYLGEIISRYSPTFAALASLREIFRVSVAAQPRCDSVVNTPSQEIHLSHYVLVDRRFPRIR